MISWAMLEQVSLSLVLILELSIKGLLSSNFQTRIRTILIMSTSLLYLWDILLQVHLLHAMVKLLIESGVARGERGSNRALLKNMFFLTTVTCVYLVPFPSYSIDADRKKITRITSWAIARPILIVPGLRFLDRIYLLTYLSETSSKVIES